MGASSEMEEDSNRRARRGSWDGVERVWWRTGVVGNGRIRERRRHLSWAADVLRITLV